jgi:hypothetical protein
MERTELHEVLRLERVFAVALSFTQDPMFDPEARDGWRADFKRLGNILQNTRN